MIRLLIAEDSETNREMLVYLFAAEPDIDVIATAVDGEEAVDMVKTLHPDIVLMDINMPRLNGFDASRIIMQSTPVPILLMSSTWDITEVEKVVESMKIGVLGIYEKPYGPGHPKFKELYNKIVLAIRLMSDVKVIRQFTFQPANHTTYREILDIHKYKCTCRCIVIGASTGGPPVLHTILKSLPADYPYPILIAQHMSSEFIDSFIEWLNNECVIHIKKADEGEVIVGGNVYIAPPKYHLTLVNKKIHLIKTDESELYVPSVSNLFASVNDASASETVAILLSGMGNDGAEEITKLKNRGTLTIGQNEATSTVFGMANEAMKRDGLEFVLSPEGISELLLGMQCPAKETK